MSKLNTALIVVVFLILAAASGWLVLSVMRPNRPADSWPDLARQLGLTYTPMELSTALTPGKISGMYGGFTVSIEANEQIKRSAYMILTVNFHQSLNLGLEMATNIYLRNQGIPDLEPFSTGQKDIDKAFKPQAQDTAGARRLFEQRPVLQAIVDLKAKADRTGVYDDKLVYVSYSLIGDVNKMKEILDLAVAAAQAIEKAQP